MADDLVDAQAAVEWAIAQFPTLMGRFEAWGRSPRYRFVSELHPEIGKKFIKLADVARIDPIINAEIGAIINSMRSSLDILMTSVVLRHSKTINPKSIYFPVVKDRAQFLRMKGYKGEEAIKALPQRERSIIENLEPWEAGGNPLLVALHNLDIVRKHQRLIDIRVDPWMIGISQRDIDAGFQAIPIWPRLKDDAIIGWSN